MYIAPAFVNRGFVWKAPSADGVAGAAFVTDGAGNVSLTASAPAMLNAANAFTLGQTVTQVASTGAPVAAITVAGGAHTALTASTEWVAFNLNGAQTLQFATGAKTTQRTARVQAPTLTAVGATTITEASTLAVSGPPVASTNVTITNPYSIVSEGGTFAARFSGGTVGTQEVQILHDGTHGYVKSMANNLRLICNGVTTALTLSSSGIFFGVDIFGSSSNLWSMDSAGWHLSSGQRNTWSSNAGNANVGIDTGLGRNAAGVVEVNSGTNGTYRDLKLRNILAGGGNGSYMQLPAMTVANLAAAATAGQGATAFVTDSTLGIGAGIGLAVVGGGANKVPVYSDGTNWIVG